MIGAKRFAAFATVERSRDMFLGFRSYRKRGGSLLGLSLMCLAIPVFNRIPTFGAIAHGESKLMERGSKPDGRLERNLPHPSHGFSLSRRAFA